MVSAGIPLILSPDFGYVILAVLFYGAVITWTGFRVISARKKHDVPLPCMFDYKNSENPFNRYQRAHYNAVEYAYIVVAMIILAGLHAPRLAAIGGVGNALGRIWYAIGYAQSTGGRFAGGSAMIPFSGLLICINLHFAATLLGVI
jgi:uncharacterized membrane protein YecN with MAPEG domain